MDKTTNKLIQLSSLLQKLCLGMKRVSCMDAASFLLPT